MEGLFYNHDNDGLTFLRLFPDGKVLSFGKSTKFEHPLPPFPYFQVVTDKTLFASGSYQIEEDRIKIRVIGDYGTIDFQGTIRENDTMYLNCRCLRAYNPVKIGIFGSYARNESRPGSDLDILIDLNTAISLFQLVRIERELSELLGVKVDLVSEGAIKNQKLKKYIKADLKIIFQS